MAAPFFYHPGLTSASKIIELDEATSKHIVQVLRMKEGEAIHLTDGKGLLALTTITSASKRSCMVTILESRFTGVLVKRKIAISISPVKNSSRFEWFLEKATELGVSEIFPLLCSRTEREHFRYDRMNNICISAMLQSQQTWLPLLHKPISFHQVTEPALAYENKFIAHCTEDEKTDLPSLLTGDIKNGIILIGPEGDFTPAEIKEAISSGYKPVSLGNTRLRTETAGMVAASILLLA